MAENNEAYLTRKREQAKLWYQNIKNNPELYAEYQRKNRLKYEKIKAQKKNCPHKRDDIDPAKKAEKETQRRIKEKISTNERQKERKRQTIRGRK